LQFFEVVFLLVLAVGIVRLLLGRVHPRLTYSMVVVVGLGSMVLGVVIEGFRWQMIPACVGFGVLVLASLKKSETRPVWRALVALPLLLLMCASAVLIHQLPVFSLPEPSGPYGVGTFAYSVTDDLRKERYAPTRNRELYVEVWYPARRGALDDFPVRTLFQELYEGDYTRQSFLFGYLGHIPTHSHVQAPVAAPEGGPFPVLLFNHALGLGFTSQNQLLMEHLASHGYVVFSIAHPYQSSKVNLGNAGTIRMTGEYPSDLSLARAELYRGLVGTIFETSNDMQEISAVKEVLSPLAEQYFALNERDRRAFLSQAVAMNELHAYRDFISEDLLEDYFVFDYQVQNSLLQYWVEDIQFVADSLEDFQGPVAGFSQSIDTSGFGVFGMSYGGAAAGEFCKIDSRCKAGVNLDGTQFGRRWNRAVSAPFLMLYHDGHQGGNDFAYLPPTHEFWDYGVKGSTHFDFTDFTYVWPLFKTLGYTGPIDGMRMIDIMNTVVLSFFDHSLKGKPVAGEWFTDFPEIVVRRHAIDASGSGR
jgi:Platelet-activating factor acetylhydrolase, isoform II